MTSNRTTSYCLSNYNASGEKELKKSKRVCSLHLEFHSPSFWPNKRNYRRRESFVESARPSHRPHSFYSGILTRQPRFLIVVNPPINSRQNDNWKDRPTQLKRVHHFNGKLSSTLWACGSRPISNFFFIVRWVNSASYHPRDPHQRWKPSCFPGLGNLV